MIFVKILYVLFFGCADIILYSLLHKKAWITRNQLTIYGVVFFVAAIFHTGFFNINFLMPPKVFLNCTMGRSTSLPWEAMNSLTRSGRKYFSSLQMSRSPGVVFWDANVASFA